MMDMLDTPIEELELSTRAISSLKKAGITTMKELTPDKFAQMRTHVRGFGRKTERELRELLQWMREAQGDLFMTPEELAAQLDDSASAIQALIQAVEGRLLQVAFKGRISMGIRHEIATKLEAAAAYARRMPAGRPNTEHPYGKDD